MGIMVVTSLSKNLLNVNTVPSSFPIKVALRDIEANHKKFKVLFISRATSELCQKVIFSILP